jgi:ABC-type multidrug transport system fused ATPase/permease subunit
MNEVNGAERVAPESPSAPPAGANGGARLPRSLIRYVLEISGAHQLALSVLTIAVFLVELIPLELQRRTINDIVKHRKFSFVIVLCAVYAGVVLVHGSTKLVLNVYRNWVGEHAVRELRKRIRSLDDSASATATDPEAQGIQVSMIVSEVEPVGAFVGSYISEPLLQGGVMLSMLAYMIHLDPWMALIALAIFVPQVVFVPLMQRAIIHRTSSRVRVLRGLSISIVQGPEAGGREREDDASIERVFELDMGIFKLKFTMNFLMNFCNHLQIVAALLLGGWYVLKDQLEVGGVVAFISAVGRLNDPWGDLVNYFRDFSVSNVKYQLIANAVRDREPGQTLALETDGGGEELVVPAKI